VEQLVERAWRALWRDGSPYHLPTAFQHGRMSGHVRVRPLASLRLPDVSDVVLFDRAPWGGVTVALRDGRLEGLNSIRAPASSSIRRAATSPRACASPG